MHDLNLPPHVLIVLPAEELPLRDRFAGVEILGGLVGAEIGGAELALAELLAERIVISEPRGLVREDCARWLCGLWVVLRG